jgi:hypothetical protein
LSAAAATVVLIAEVVATAAVVAALVGAVVAATVVATAVVATAVVATAVVAALVAATVVAAGRLVLVAVLSPQATRTVANKKSTTNSVGALTRINEILSLLFLKLHQKCVLASSGEYEFRT